MERVLFSFSYLILTQPHQGRIAISIIKEGKLKEHVSLALFFFSFWLVYNVVLVSGVEQSDLVIYVCLVTQSCSTLCDPQDYSPLGFSFHGIMLGRTLE